MMRRSKHLIAIASIATLIVLGLLFFAPLSLTRRDPVTELPQAAPSFSEAPAPLPFEFEDLPGVQRGGEGREYVIIPSTNTRIPFRRLDTMFSHVGEGKIEFLHRVRLEMLAFSEKNHFEACGEICTADQRHAVILTSISAAAYCAVKSICPEGFTSTQQSIHSHCPSVGTVRATLADEHLSAGLLKRRKTFGTCDTENFSSTDYAGRRPGWLAGRKALYLQNGPNDIKTFH